MSLINKFMLINLITFQAVFSHEKDKKDKEPVKRYTKEELLEIRSRIKEDYKKKLDEIREQLTQVLSKQEQTEPCSSPQEEFLFED